MKKPLLLGIILTACIVIVAFVFSLGYPGGMVSYWKFDEGVESTASDSVDENDGTIHGAQWTTFGKVNGALSFDGVDDYVEIPDDNSLDITGDLTLEAWIEPDRVYYTAQGEIIGKWVAGNASYYFAINIGKLQMRISATGSDYYNIEETSNANLSIDTWYHVVGVYDASEQDIKLYINGVVEESTTVEGIIPSIIHSGSAKVKIGGFSPGYYFDGIIDEAAIYNRALSAGEIQQHYENRSYEVECTTPPDNMVSWWPGDGNADDIVGNNDGAVYDAIYVPGKVDQAFSFDGDGDYVEVLDDPTLDITDSITLEAWIKADSTQTGNAAGIITKDDLYSDGRSYNLHLSSASSPTPWALRMRLLTLNNDGIIDGTTDLRDNTWHHVAGTWDGSIMNLYVDGILQNSRSSTGSISITPTPVIIGDFGSSRYGQYGFDGIIDEVEIFNRALTASEIQDIYLAGSAGKCKYIKVDIDIKPGSNPNSINLSSAGVIPVAILSTSDFNAPEEVDPATVSLAGAEIKVAGKSGKYLSHAEDVNDDGLPDLVCQVLITEDWAIELGETSAVLEALTYDGQSIRGEDAIRIVPDK